MEKTTTWSKELHSKWSPHTSLAWAASVVAHVGPRSLAPKPSHIYTTLWALTIVTQTHPVFEPFFQGNGSWVTSLSHLESLKVHLHTPSQIPKRIPFSWGFHPVFPVLEVVRNFLAQIWTSIWRILLNSIHLTTRKLNKVAIWAIWVGHFSEKLVAFQVWKFSIQIAINMKADHMTLACCI